MPTYSFDLRERIIAAREDGHSAEEVARLFRVSRRSVERYWKAYQTTGAVDITLAELRERITQDLGITVGNTALWHRLERLGLSYKKNAARRRARPGGPPGRPPKLARATKKLAGSKAGLYR